MRPAFFLKRSTAKGFAPAPARVFDKRRSAVSPVFLRCASCQTGRSPSACAALALATPPSPGGRVACVQPLSRRKTMTTLQSYGENVAAIAAMVHQDKETYQKIYENIADHAGGFVGIWGHLRSRRASVFRRGGYLQVRRFLLERGYRILCRKDHRLPAGRDRNPPFQICTVWPQARLSKT